MQDRRQAWGSLAYLLVGAIFALLRFLLSFADKESVFVASLFDAAHFFVASLIMAVASSVGERVRVWGQWIPWAALSVIACVAGFLYLGDDVDGFARRQQAVPRQVAHFGCVGMLAASVVVASWAGARLDRKAWRWSVLAAGLLIVWMNGQVLENDYFGMHVFAAWAALAASGAAFRGAMGRPERLREWPTLSLAFVLLGPVLIFPPSARVQTALANSTGAVFSRLFARTSTSVSTRMVGHEASEWLVPRATARPLPPNEERPLKAPELVILVTIDALRADVIHSKKYDDLLPTFARLRDEGLSFRQARAPGTLTKTSLSSVFMGTYFSQQFWSPMEDRNGAMTVHADDTPRFTEILKGHGVASENFRAVSWLRNGVVMRGFERDVHVQYPKEKSYYTPSRPVFERLIPRVRHLLKSNRPAFVYTHLSDPHAPYDQGKVKNGSEFRRYLSEVELVDSQLKKLVRLLEGSQRKESILLIVSADHGEAFGEHKSKTHGTTMYDEVLHVPLIFWRAGEAWRRQVEDVVTLVDLGPTILDVFGAATPGHMMGQSLVPYLNGGSPHLTRPVFAETRLMRALVTPERMKLIVDVRTGRRELYDLNQDPEEVNNLADEHNLLSEPLSLMESFFEVHTLRRDGYSLPFVK